jgi:hypothetical protein
MLDIILEWFPDDEFLKVEGFDDAIIGIDESSMRLIYSESKCIQILIEQGMTHEDAIEHFQYNIKNGYVGESTPIWCSDEY